jgi:hypothetical protein
MPQRANAVEGRNSRGMGRGDFVSGDAANLSPLRRTINEDSKRRNKHRPYGRESGTTEVAGEAGHPQINVSA